MHSISQVAFWLCAHHWGSMPRLLWLPFLKLSLPSVHSVAVHMEQWEVWCLCISPTVVLIACNCWIKSEKLFSENNLYVIHDSFMLSLICEHVFHAGKDQLLSTAICSSYRNTICTKQAVASCSFYNECVKTIIITPYIHTHIQNFFCTWYFSIYALFWVHLWQFYN